MTIIRSVVTFEAKSGMPEDRAQNVFHFNIPVGPVEAADYAEIGAALAAFYIADPLPADALAGPPMALMSNQSVSVELPTVLHYELDGDGNGGSPDGFSDFVAGWAPPAVAGLPAEVSLAVSFHATLTGIAEEIEAGVPGPAGDLKPRARRRGRIYLPFLNTNVLSARTDGVRPSDVAMYSLKWAAQNLSTRAGLAARGIEWCVYSKKDNLARPVTGGWCDNSFGRAADIPSGLVTVGQAVAAGARGIGVRKGWVVHVDTRRTSRPVIFDD